MLISYHVYVSHKQMHVGKQVYEHNMQSVVNDVLVSFLQTFISVHA